MKKTSKNSSDEDAKKQRASDAAAKLKLSRQADKSARNHSYYASTQAPTLPSFEHTNKKDLFKLLQESQESAQQAQASAAKHNEDLSNTIVQLIASLHDSQRSEKLLQEKLADLQEALVQNSEQHQHKQQQQQIAFDRLQADHTSYRHAAAACRRGDLEEHNQARDKIYQQQDNQLRVNHASAVQAVQKQTSLQAINTKAYQTSALQQHLIHTRALQQQKAAHQVELAAQKAGAATLYNALHAKCSKHLQTISVQIQKQHAEKLKHTALLSAATIHQQQPAARADIVRLKLLANITNHTISKHRKAMLTKGKPGPKPADTTPSTPTVGLRDTQVGNATPTSAYKVDLVLKMAKMQTDGRIPTSRVTDCARGAAEMILSEAYPHNMPGTTTLREARRITDALYIRAVRSECNTKFTNNLGCMSANKPTRFVTQVL